ncbi:hypothetical protein [Oligoflexus tunisiensis]|uniref:hypothetical protein n=1 Tax=Oligoflexus tunisiensis TaxID=708132 RepID=UPI00114D32E2|nr:hypothetical protein [Oligoflexus tunisiensis]
MEILKKNRFSTVCTGLLALLLLSCGEKSDDKSAKSGGGGESEVANLVFGDAALVASDLSQAALADAAGVVADCAFQADIYRGEGSCTTPNSFVAYTGVLTALSETGSTPDEARLASTFNYHVSANGSIQQGLEIDFASGTSFSAYNELWAQYEIKDTYKYAGLSLAYEKIKFQVKDKFVTMFLAAYSQPFVQWEEVFDGCSISETDKTQSRYSDADLLPGMTFERGDYLFCVKDNDADVCAAEDYKWLDLDSNQLVATRPTNPRVHQFLVNDEPTCSTEGGNRHNPSWSPIRLGATFDKTFQLYADFSHGNNSVQWKDSMEPFVEEATEPKTGEFVEPWLIYYHKEEGASEVTSGTDLDMTFDFGSQDLIYFDGLRASDVDSSTLEAVLAKAYARHDWYFQKKGEDNIVGFEMKDYAILSVKATITVSGGTEKPEE